MREFSKTKIRQVESGLTKVAGGAIGEVEQIVESTSQHFERTINPIRQGLFKRFPTAFLMAGTFGLVATMTGIEQILIRTELLQNHPWIILSLGIGILMLTGTLYRKLG